jgi:hypothetical protein
VFAALLHVLARRRWASAAWYDAEQARPPVGQRYVSRNGTVVRRGRIVECLQPVLLTLYESLFDPPCRVRLRLRWRLEPQDTGTSVLLDARYELNGPAYLNRRHWREEISGHCGRMLSAVGSTLADGVGHGIGVRGQRIGSSAMTVTNTTAVNGKPTLK